VNYVLGRHADGVEDHAVILGIMKSEIGPQNIKAACIPETQNFSCSSALTDLLQIASL